MGLGGRILRSYEGILLADLAFQPSVTARLAFLMTPHVITDIDTLIIFNALITDVAVIFFEFLKEGFLEIFLL